MRNLLALLAIGFVSVGLSICLSSAMADRPKPEATSSDSNDNESVEVLHARAHLELAQCDLRRAMEWNKRIPKSLSAQTIAKLRRHVVIRDEQLQQCLLRENADLHKVCIRRAETAIEIAEADLTRRQAIHQRMPTAFSALDVERAGIVARVAKLDLEKTRTQEPSESAFAHLQWQIEELQHEVLELQLQKWR